MIPEFAMGTEADPCEAGSEGTESEGSGNSTGSSWAGSPGTGSGGPFTGNGFSAFTAATGSGALGSAGSVGIESGQTGSGSAWEAGRCPDFLCGLHYLHFAALLFVATCAIAVAVSLCHPPIAKRHVSAGPRGDP